MAGHGGKKVFGIKHYWVRYEFAPGRGQIHAHLLAIPEEHSIYELCHLDLQLPNGSELRAVRLAEWAEKSLGLTANVSEDFDDLKIDRTNTPVRLRFKDISQTEESREEDFQQMMNHVQGQVHDWFLYEMHKRSRHVRPKGGFQQCRYLPEASLTLMCLFPLQQKPNMQSWMQNRTD